MQQPLLVVMGVSGCGKTTVARLLADRLGVPYAEADDFHPAANIAKMSAGDPLDDDDRWPWLRLIAEWMHEHADTGGVVTCSALKRRYRDLLRESDQVTFVHLRGDHQLIAARMAGRSGHFMPTSLLDSQYAALEPLGPDEPGVVLDAAASAEELVEQALSTLKGVPA
jgi:gluconokinase